MIDVVSKIAKACRSECHSTSICGLSTMSTVQGGGSTDSQHQAGSVECLTAVCSTAITDMLGATFVARLHDEVF